MLVGSDGAAVAVRPAVCCRLFDCIAARRLTTSYVLFSVSSEEYEVGFWKAILIGRVFVSVFKAWLVAFF